ncbi:hypothetical protein [Streptomyces chryseus]
MTHLQLFARRLSDGSGILARQLAVQAASWVRAGRRDDLTGLAAVLGCILRAVLVAAGLYLLWRLIRAFPALMWVAVPAWCWGAVRSSPHDEAEQDAPQTAGPAASTEALRTLVSDLIGDRPGVHLAVLLAHLQAHGQGKGWAVADLRTRLEASGVPVRRSVKVGRRVAYGVHRNDLTAPSPAGAEQDAA